MQAFVLLYHATSVDEGTETSIEGVFSSRENAEAAQRPVERPAWDYWDIEEYTIDG